MESPPIFNSRSISPVRDRTVSTKLALYETRKAIPIANFPRPLNDYLTTTKFVNIYVGPSAKLWVVHEELLCDFVPFFKEAFRSGSKETIDKTIHLPGDSPEAFALLIEWLYIGQFSTQSRMFCSHCRKKPVNEAKIVEHEATHQLQWCQLWVLAQKLMMSRFADNCVERLRTCFVFDRDMPLAPEVAAYIDEETTGDSPIRNMLVETVIQALFCKTSKNIPEWGTGSAGSDSFNADVMQAIQDHLTLTDEKSCSVYWCMVHGTLFTSWKERHQSMAQNKTDSNDLVEAEVMIHY